MKPTYIADAFSQIDDAYINESHPAAIAAGGRKPRAEGSVRRFLGSGWGAAILSAAAALLVMTGIVFAGRMGANTPGPGGQIPVPGTDEDSDRVDIVVTNPTEQENDGEHVSGTSAETAAETTLETDPGTQPNTSGTPTVTVTVNGEAVSLGVGNLFSASGERDAGNGMAEAINMDGMPPDTLQDIRDQDSGITIRYEQENGFSLPLPLTDVRLSQGTAVFESLRIYTENGNEISRNTEIQSTKTIPAGLEEGKYYVVLVLSVKGFDYEMMGKTYRVTSGHASVVFHIEPVSYHVPAEDFPLKFDFDIVAPDGYVRGKTIYVHTFMTNVSGNPVHYTGPSSDVDARIRLTHLLYNDVCYRLDQERLYTTDIIERDIAPGETITETIPVYISEDAPDGAYDLTMYYTNNPDWVVSFRKVFYLSSEVDQPPDTTSPLPTDCPFIFECYIGGMDGPTHHGDQISVHYTMTNRLPEDYRHPGTDWSNRLPKIRLYATLPDGERYYLHDDFLSDTSNGTVETETDGGDITLSWSAGQTTVGDFVMLIPNDAPVGPYTAEVYFGENPYWYHVFENALIVESPTDTPNPFTFDYSVKAPNGIRRGETITVDISMTNTSAELFAIYTGSGSYNRPFLSIYCERPGWKTYHLIPEQEITDDNAYHIWAPGETTTATYQFQIPDDVYVDNYTVKVYFGAIPSWNLTVENGLTVEEAPLDTAQ